MRHGEGELRSIVGCLHSLTTQLMNDCSILRDCIALLQNYLSNFSDTNFRKRACALCSRIKVQNDLLFQINDHFSMVSHYLCGPSHADADTIGFVETLTRKAPPTEPLLTIPEQTERGIDAEEYSGTFSRLPESGAVIAGALADIDDRCTDTIHFLESGAMMARKIVNNECMRMKSTCQSMDGTISLCRGIIEKVNQRR